MRRICLDHVVEDEDCALISAVSPSILHGKGVFTTIAMSGGEPLLWEKHWRRLRSHASRTGVDIERFPEEQVKASVSELSACNSDRDGRARVTILDTSPGGLWECGPGPPSRLLIMTGARRPRRSIRLTLSPFRINSASPLAGIKSCSYLEKVLAREEAERRGFDEAVQLNESGQIATAVMANIFWIKDGTFHTPPLASGCLAGTTRELMMENIECQEVEEPAESLNAANSILLTSAGLGAAWVSELEGRQLDVGGSAFPWLPDAYSRQE